MYNKKYINAKIVYAKAMYNLYLELAYGIKSKDSKNDLIKKSIESEIANHLLKT